MNLTIKATKTKLTPAIKNAITEKLHAIDKFLGPEDKIHVEVAVEPKSKTGDSQRAEIAIHPHGYYAVAYSADFYSALDLVIPKIKEQLKKRKDKQLTQRKKAGKFKAL